MVRGMSTTEAHHEALKIAPPLGRVEPGGVARGEEAAWKEGGGLGGSRGCGLPDGGLQ